MPSKSPAQARLMAAAAHTKGGYGGVPQAVGKEFNKADAGTGILEKHAERIGARRARRKFREVQHPRTHAEFERLGRD